jgi:Ni,Fe-hydrogenase I small subunit
MFLPTQHAMEAGETLGDRLQSHGVSRREFLDFCGKLAIVLGLGELAGPRVARALQAVRRPSVIWIQLQECTGCVESVLCSAPWSPP